MYTKTIKKLIYFGEGFLPILDKYERMIKRDKNMMANVDEKQIKKIKKRGIFTQSIKVLIENYVDSNWDNFVNSKKRRGGNQNNETENRDIQNENNPIPQQDQDV